MTTDNPLLQAIRTLPVGVDYALYGAGQFTARCLNATAESDLFADGRFLVGIVDDQPGSLSVGGYPRASLAEAVSTWSLDWLILSTDCHQRAMIDRITQAWRQGLVEERLRLALIEQRGFQAWRATANTEELVELAAAAIEVVAEPLGGLNGRTVLDYAAGESFTAAMAFAAGGAQSYAIDRQLLEGNWRWFDERQRYLVSCLEKRVGRPVAWERLRTAAYGGPAMPFTDGMFDAVVWSWPTAATVRQPGFLADLARVVRPGGCLFVRRHDPEAVAAVEAAGFSLITDHIRGGMLLRRQ